MNIQVTEMMALQKQMVAKSAERSQFPTEHVEVSDELSRVKLQSVAGATVSDDLEQVAGAGE